MVSERTKYETDPAVVAEGLRPSVTLPRLAKGSGLNPVQDQSHSKPNQLLLIQN